MEISTVISCLSLAVAIVVAHDRLSEPIVAAPNETVTFSYEIAFN